MISRKNTTWASYDSDSTKYFENYNKLYFSNVHKQFIKFLPPNVNAKILDIGCGSGRDALSLARRGYQVTAVEPSNKMLALAQEKNSHKNIAWVNDCLPHLSTLCNNTYDFILMSAVWMHIAPKDRNVSIKRLSDLLKAGRHLAITLRIGAPDTNRIMYPTPIEEILNLSSEYNLTPAYISRETKDSMNREEIIWRKIVFIKNNTVSTCPP